MTDNEYYRTLYGQKYEELKRKYNYFIKKMQKEFDDENIKLSIKILALSHEINELKSLLVAYQQKDIENWSNKQCSLL